LNETAESSFFQPHKNGQEKSEAEYNKGRDDYRQDIHQANIFYVRLHDAGKYEDWETKKKDEPVSFLDKLGLQPTSLLEQVAKNNNKENWRYCFNNCHDLLAKCFFSSCFCHFDRLMIIQIVLKNQKYGML